MFAKAIAIATILAVAQAGAPVYYDTHVGAQSEQTIRGLGFGGLSTLTSQSKAVDSAFSSVRRHESRLINPAVSVSPVAYHAAPVAQYHAAPVAQYHAAPVAQYHAAPVAQYHAAPVAQYHAAPVAQYHAAPVAQYHAAPVAQYHAAPVATYAAARAPVSTTTTVASGNGLGVAYSAVPQVAHLYFDGFGAHYEY